MVCGGASAHGAPIRCGRSTHLLVDELSRSIDDWPDEHLLKARYKHHKDSKLPCLRLPILRLVQAHEPRRRGIPTRYTQGGRRTFRYRQDGHASNSSQSRKDNHGESSTGRVRIRLYPAGDYGSVHWGTGNRGWPQVMSVAVCRNTDQIDETCDLHFQSGIYCFDNLRRVVSLGGPSVPRECPNERTWTMTGSWRRRSKG